MSQGNSEYQIRALKKSDNLTELTSLLHLAYKKQADRGQKFLASHQTVDTTKDRISNGQCFVVIEKNSIITTITYYPPTHKPGNKFYDPADVATFGQLAVHPDFQNSGIGRQLIKHVEMLAIRDGAKKIRIDTSENSNDLLEYYERLGYRPAGWIKWEKTNYRSCILNKDL